MVWIHHKAFFQFSGSSTFQIQCCRSFSNPQDSNKLFKLLFDEFSLAWQTKSHFELKVDFLKRVLNNSFIQPVILINIQMFVIAESNDSEKSPYSIMVFLFLPQNQNLMSPFTFQKYFENFQMLFGSEEVSFHFQSHFISKKHTVL